MALTRHATGNSQPRKPFTQPTTTTTTTTTKTTKKSGTGAVSRPRKTGGVTTGRVTKKSAATPAKKRGRPTLKDKVEGAIEKTKGVVERKPGKKAAGTRKMRGETGTGAGRKKKVL
ncbi:MAG: hypothetical protein MMC33_003939 [Icmadophila ericetorum]|nr:hypothetical protein [Icmadophila ericetorum]